MRIVCAHCNSTDIWTERWPTQGLPWRSRRCIDCGKLTHEGPSPGEAAAQAEYEAALDICRRDNEHLQADNDRLRNLVFRLLEAIRYVRMSYELTHVPMIDLNEDDDNTVTEYDYIVEDTEKAAKMALKLG